MDLNIKTKFTFMGLSFMSRVSALEKKGNDHTISLFKTKLQQVMGQLYIERKQIFHTP
jgi:L-lactate dehydrogenase (cytochrome)